MTITCHPASDVAREVNPFLRGFGRMGPVHSSDSVFVVRDDQTLIGCVRLAREHGVCVLRSLLVHPQHQGRGHGAALVRALLAQHEWHRGQPIYCLAYPELLAWYEQQGFEVVADADLPAHLRLRQLSLRLQHALTIGLRAVSQNFSAVDV